MDRSQAIQRHKELTEQGWVRRFTAEEPRLSEMKEFYESLGMEVLLETGLPEEGQECTGCFEIEGFQDRLKTIYTREQGSAGGEGQELFE